MSKGVVSVAVTAEVGPLCGEELTWATKANMPPVLLGSSLVGDPTGVACAAAVGLR